MLVGTFPDNKNGFSPSPDWRGNLFVPGFGTKNCNGKRELPSLINPEPFAPKKLDKIINFLVALLYPFYILNRTLCPG